MIIIKTKKAITILDEKNVVTIEYEKKRHEVWIRFMMPDGSYKSERCDSVISVEYRPSTEPFIITEDEL